MELANEDVERLRNELETIEASVETVRRILDGGDGGAVAPKFLVFRDVYEEGCIVTRERWHEIGAEHGFEDPRGLSGLFAWGKWVEKIAGDRVALTDDAVDRLDRLGLIDDE